VYAENARQATEAALHRLLVQESLASGLISSATAFIAVRSENGKPVERTVAVANALPAGWSADFLGPMAAAPVFMTLSAGPVPRGFSPHTLMSLGDTGVQEVQEQARDSGPPGDVLRRAVGYLRGGLGRHPGAHAAGSAEPGVLFAGVPTFEHGEALLFDSTHGEERLPDHPTLSRLHLRFPKDAPPTQTLDPGLALLLFLDDLSQPRARVRLVDLIRQGGQRPLNLTRRSGQCLRIVLTDPNGAWSQNPPPIEVSLE
jgi:Ca-activated chloride channel family protein